jgi:hypothetical protein
MAVTRVQHWGEIKRGAAGFSPVIGRPSMACVLALAPSREASEPKIASKNIWEARGL